MGIVGSFAELFAEEFFIPIWDTWYYPKPVWLTRYEGFSTIEASIWETGVDQTWPYYKSGYNIGMKTETLIWWGVLPMGFGLQEAVVSIGESPWSEETDTAQAGLWDWNRGFVNQWWLLYYRPAPDIGEDINGALADVLDDSDVPFPIRKRSASGNLTLSEVARNIIVMHDQKLPDLWQGSNISLLWHDEANAKVYIRRSEHMVSIERADAVVSNFHFDCDAWGGAPYVPNGTIKYSEEGFEPEDKRTSRWSFRIYDRCGWPATHEDHDIEQWSQANKSEKSFFKPPKVYDRVHQSHLNAFQLANTKPYFDCRVTASGGHLKELWSFIQVIEHLQQQLSNGTRVNDIFGFSPANGSMAEQMVGIAAEQTRIPFEHQLANQCCNPNGCRTPRWSATRDSGMSEKLKAAIDELISQSDVPEAKQRARVLGLNILHRLLLAKTVVQDNSTETFKLGETIFDEMLIPATSG